MDAAYDTLGDQCLEHGQLGHVPIIDTNPRRGETGEMDPAQAVRLRNRPTAARVNLLEFEGQFWRKNLFGCAGQPR